MLNVFYRDSHLQGRMSGPLKVIGNLFKSLDELKDTTNQKYSEVLNENIEKVESFLQTLKK